MEIEIKAEPCTDIKEEPIEEPISYEDFEESKFDLNSQNSGFYNENETQSQDEANNQNFEEMSYNNEFYDDRNEEVLNKKNAIAKTTAESKKHYKSKAFQTKHVKCGDIYWSRVNECYVYACPMCPTEEFRGSKSLLYHYKKCHHQKIRKSDKKEKSESSSDSTDSDSNDVDSGAKDIALQQLQQLASRNLTKKKKNKDSQTIKKANKSRFFCIFCDAIFLQLETLKLHQGHKHRGIYKFECKFCTKKFSHYEEKKHHERRQHGKNSK